ncbi:LUD domain protein [uncultured archaeon]|nr:LUD domain protein [uncultured archaeon]
MSNWDVIPSDSEIESTIKAVKARGINVILVKNKFEALDALKKFIPAGSEVMNGSSTTLNEIGFGELLKSGNHKWKNLHAEILKETNPDKQADLRRKSACSEYFLGSVNAISKNGELVACDASGSRVTAYPGAAKNVILIAGVQKITDSLESAMKRIREYVFPLEDARAMKAYGMHSNTSKWVIIEREFNPKRMTLILVKEKLGF